MGIVLQNLTKAVAEWVNPLTMEQFDRSVEQVKKIMGQPAFLRARHVIGCGCGDSNIAAFAVKDAFAHYLPEVDYEGVEAIEFSRHYEYEEDGSDTLAIFISVSGSINRTNEALRQCARHGITTVAVTDNPTSQTAREADILFYENSPEGDNNAGLRTYYVGVMSVIILAAAMAEVRRGKSYLPELRAQVQSYHDAFFGEYETIEDFCFAAAIHWMDMKLGSGADCGNLVLIDSHDGALCQIADAVNAMVSEGGREILLFCDKTPDQIGITEKVRYCHVPVPEKDWSFLTSIYAYLPGALFAGFRHTTIGEPMFRGGMDPNTFVPTYFSPVEVVDL